LKYLLCATAFALLAVAPAFAVDKAEKTMVATIDDEIPRAETLLEKLVNQNSGTLNFAGVEKVGQMMREELEPLGFTVRWSPMAQVGRAGHIIAEHPGPKNYKGTKMLLIGHLDTVFELSSPFQTYKGLSPGIAEGPGTNDMKGGDVIMVQALRAMKAAGVLKDAAITIVLTGDEERSGSPKEIARADLDAAANASDVALEFEGLTRVDGKDYASISRRGGTGWTLKVTATSGHSSQIFSPKLGDGAVYEMARILTAFRQELPEQYLTFNVGVMVAGSSADFNKDSTGGSALGKSNVIPGVALASGDMRTMTIEQADRIKAKMKAIIAKNLPQTSAEITFSESGPGMPPTDYSRGLLAKLNVVNKDLGLAEEPELDPMLRGGGDISGVAHLIKGGLIGLGAAGEGSHAPGETIDLRSLPTQAKRAALLMYRLSKTKP
jgi:glutamate carboxypeptidase